MNKKVLRVEGSRLGCEMIEKPHTRDQAAGSLPAGAQW